MTLRPYRDADLPAVATLFTESIHGLAVPHYDAAQRDAWAPRPPDLAQWRARLAGLSTVLAERDGRLAGFVSYADDGHIDLLYTAPDAARSGVAAALCAEAEQRLAQAGVARLFTEASLVAAPFFAQQGFAVAQEQRVQRGGLWFRRYAMHKTLRPGAVAQTSVMDVAGLRARVTAPPSPQAGLPLLLFLHGRDEGAPTPFDAALSLHGPLAPQAPLEVAQRFIVAAPQLPQQGDHWHRHADAVRALVGQLQREHGADPARCYLSGFSFGGNGVFDLGLAQPDLWAALWSVDPTRPPQPPLQAPAWLSIGDAARPREAEFIASLGSQGYDGSPAGRRVHLDQQRDHVGSARMAYADLRIYQWLLEQVRA